MVQAQPATLTFADYLAHDDGTDTRYELVRGQLIAMTPPTWQHLLIARYLERLFEVQIQQLGTRWLALQGAGQQVNDDTSRLPDVIVVPIASIQDDYQNTAVLSDAAILAVEIVSPSSTADDYLHKLAEYEAKGIAEYWIVDPLALGASRYIGTPKHPTISIYRLAEGEYLAPLQFREGDVVESAIFPELRVTAQEIFGQ
ncbi:Uma2 family endonuclease [Nodosilinea sp. LEGE 07088]|uniref:Uma2 family endonuclease n=1 Tax=Nodosilinea sp. LEGE 07088 TaxID=2777968 RepID=UPI001883006D|nr:Uma2 family endonuclease [Nodosilinea sp. LEGE 07088]MBE9136140.1 Uma2 family endonuclease [Nodosilinea sp. LEGE 07088]